MFNSHYDFSNPHLTELKSLSLEAFGSNNLSDINISTYNLGDSNNYDYENSQEENYRDNRIQSINSKQKKLNKMLNVSIPQNDVFKLKRGGDLESVVSQFQRHVPFILCVKDGSEITWFPENGPFPRPLSFEVKQKRNDVVEYYFRYQPNTNQETVYCVFGRMNAETFSESYVDDENTESEDESVEYYSETENTDYDIESQKSGTEIEGEEVESQPSESQSEEQEEKLESISFQEFNDFVKIPTKSSTKSLHSQENYLINENAMIKFNKNRHNMYLLQN
jgi:hypothetical protein